MGEEVADEQVLTGEHLAVPWARAMLPGEGGIQQGEGIRGEIIVRSAGRRRHRLDAALNGFGRSEWRYSLKENKGNKKLGVNWP